MVTSGVPQGSVLFVSYTTDVERIIIEMRGLLQDGPCEPPGSRLFYQLCRIKTIRRFIPTSTAVFLINSFIVSRVDYCNSLLAGLPICELERIQSVLNSAAHLIYGWTTSDHVTDLL